MGSAITVWKSNYTHLEELEILALKRFPDGFRVQRIDSDSASLMEKQRGQADDYCALPHYFCSADDLLARSFGCFIRDAEMVHSFAISYCPCASKAEVRIEIRPEAQRKEFALTVAAAFILECMDRGLKPLWTTTNTISAKLAEKLGYKLTKASECLLLAKGIFDPAMNVEYDMPGTLRRFSFGKRSTYSHQRESSRKNA